MGETLERQLELRLCLVMTGGVSLAVWMGGVALEVHRFAHREHTYGKLLDELQVEPQVDILSGASAGGLNGVLLGAAVANGRTPADLRAIRDVWFDRGAFAELLRSPFQGDPPSLLKGDEYFLPAIEDVLRPWMTGPEPEPSSDDDPRPKVHILVAATSLTAEPVRRQDDYGQPVDESSHAMVIHFEEEKGHLHGELAARRLALAARTSASYPGAFEASFLPIGEDGPDGRPDMAEVAAERTSRFAIDGGVLRNKPIGPAVDTIYNQPAMDVPVRRVLLYVNPDPGRATQPVPVKAEDAPSLGSVLGQALYSLPRDEAIADDLDQLRSHNERVRLQQEQRAGLLELTPPALGGLAAQLYEPVFRRVRAIDSVRGTSARISARAAELGLTDRDFDWRRVEKRLVASAKANWLPADWSTTFESPWRLGLSPLEYGVSISRDLLRTHQGSFDAPTEERASKLRAKASDLVDAINCLRDLDDAYWDVQVARLAALGAAGISEWSSKAYVNWPTLSGINLGALDAALVRRHALAAEAAGFDPDGLSRDVVLERLTGIAASVALLLAHAATLIPDAPKENEARAALPFNPLGMLVALYVSQVSLSGNGVLAREQPVDVLQVSADITHDVSPTAAAAADKLTGVQLMHFGAFYKRSWRANDWIWGRLDSTTRLLLAALHPPRLHQLAPPGKAVRHWLPVIEDVVTGGESSGWRTDRWRALRPDVIKELALLNDPDELPPAMTATARALALPIHLEILREELPVLAATLRVSAREGAVITPQSQDFLSRIATLAPNGRLDAAEDAAVVELFGRSNVRDERLGDEATDDLFVATLSQAAAVAGAATSGKRAGLGPLRNAFRVIRLPVLAAHVMARAAARGGRFGTALGAASLATAGGVLAVALLTRGGEGSEVPATLVAIAVAVAILWTLVIAIAGGAILALTVPLLAATVVAATFLSDEVDLLFGSETRPWKTTLIERRDEVFRGLWVLAVTSAAFGVWAMVRRRRVTGASSLLLGLGGALVALAHVGLDPLAAAMRVDTDWGGNVTDAFDGLERHRVAVVAGVLPAALLALGALRLLSGRRLRSWLAPRSYGPAEPSRRGAWWWLAAIVVSAAAVGLHLHWVSRHDDAESWCHLAVGLTVAFVVFGVWTRPPQGAAVGDLRVAIPWILLTILLGAGLWVVDAQVADWEGKPWSKLGVHAVYILLGVALLEELLFRQIVPLLFAKATGAKRTWAKSATVVGAVASSLLFGLWHLQDGGGFPGSLGVVLLTAVGGGGVFTYLRLRSGGLAAPVAVHAALNIFVLIGAAQ